jgi:hypothetical protein
VDAAEHRRRDERPDDHDDEALEREARTVLDEVHLLAREERDEHLGA